MKRFYQFPIQSPPSVNSHYVIPISKTAGKHAYGLITGTGSHRCSRQNSPAKIIVQNAPQRNHRHIVKPTTTALVALDICVQTTFFFRNWPAALKGLILVSFMYNRNKSNRHQSPRTRLCRPPQFATQFTNAVEVRLSRSCQTTQQQLQQPQRENDCTAEN